MLLDLLKVHINFERSHLVFPAIIEWLLLIFALIILVQRHAAIRASVGNFVAHLAPTHWQFDRVRLFGTLGLTVVYFWVMEPVGRIWANTGMGFLICSVIYCLALARLLAHEVTLHKWRAITLISLIGPSVVWFIFSQVFRISLP